VGHKNKVQGSEVQGSEVQRFRVQRFRGSGFRGSRFQVSGVSTAIGLKSGQSDHKRNPDLLSSVPCPLPADT